VWWWNHKPSLVTCAGVRIVELRRGRGRVVAAVGDDERPLHFSWEGDALRGAALDCGSFKAVAAHAAAGDGVVGAASDGGRDVAIWWRNGRPQALDAGGRPASATAVDGDDVGGLLRTPGGPRPVLWRTGDRKALLPDDDDSVGRAPGRCGAAHRRGALGARRAVVRRRFARCPRRSTDLRRRRRGSTAPPSSSAAR
jgi:hypothetical protein